MAAMDALPRAAILYLYRKHLTRDAQTIIIQPQYYRKYQKWAEFICNKVIRTKLFDGYVVVERCILNDYLKSEPIVCSVIGLCHNKQYSSKYFKLSFSRY